MGKQVLKTPITYYGGKQTMLKHILPLVPNHTLYTESFVGGAALLFAKEPAEVEVINDLNSELINFYWVAQMYYRDLKKEIDKTLHARELHQHAQYIYENPQFFTPVSRAWAFWVNTKMSFASKVGGSFGFDKSKRTVTKKIENAKDAFTVELCARLNRVTIESQDALQVIKRYDTANAFHFVDPPYINSNCGHYEGMFNDQNLGELLDLLVSIKGKFMLTMYPYPLIESTAKEHGWIIHRAMRTISASLDKRKKKEEWIVVNY